MSESISNDINYPVLKTILKYNDHPSIKATEKISKLNKLVEFSNVVKGEILNEIVNQDGLKSFQDTDCINKNHADIFADSIHLEINASINKNRLDRKSSWKEFPSFSKIVNVIRLFKKASENSNIITDQ